MNISKWRAGVGFMREEKDLFFKMHTQSPLLLDDRQKFEGLNYYAPDPDYRFELRLREHDHKDTLKIEDTRGNEREFLIWGEFEFTIGDQTCTLQAYKSSPQEKRLFIPFRDITSGKETYGAGRYLDLDEDHYQTAQGNWILDFNQAYNPWCAYSDQYACPFVDPENWLKVAIRAGEKNFRV
jgi:uncharacterized protein (DUF1684 family)